MEIRYGCFSHCSNLESIEVESENTFYDSRDNCNAIVNTTNNTMIAACKNTTIPSTVTSLDEYCFYGCTGLTSIDIPNSVTRIGDSCFSGCTGLTSIEIPNSVTSIGQRCFNNCTGLTTITISNSVTGLRDACFSDCASLTNITIPNSVTAFASSCFLGCNNLSTIYCYPIPYMYYVNKNIRLSGTDAEVKLYGGPSYEISLHKATPTTLTFQLTPNNNFEGNLTTSLSQVSLNNQVSEPIGENQYRITGLETGTQHDVTVTLQYSDFKKIDIVKTYSTLNPELTMQQPRCVSSTCAIVSASTHLSDDETSLGFQWKKYDAPESLKPNEAYAAVYNGTLEGYLKNLQPTSYYNVRAFYKTEEEGYYYSDWVTFDPSDFSYFEPTVHTYPVTEVTDYTATVRGYALAGTDEIAEQGFEYWESNGGSATLKLEKAAAMATAEEGHQTVLSTGQVMQVVLDNLKPMTTYIFRAFVRTASGTTYGEEQTFTTTIPESIGHVEIEGTAPAICGYYDLSGRRLAGKQRGVNIVRYSDGTSRKIMVK